MDTIHRAFNHTGTYLRPVPTEEMIQHATAFTTMSVAEKHAPTVVPVEMLKLVGLCPSEHNSITTSTIDGPDALVVPIDQGNPSHRNFTTADSSTHMSLQPTTSRRDIRVIVGMFHQLLTSYDEIDDVSESREEESAQTHPLMLESVHDNIDLLVQKTATVEVVRDISNYEGDPVTRGVQDILRGVTQLMVSQPNSSNLQEKLATAEPALEEHKKLSALSDAKYKHDKDELEGILCKRLAELRDAQTELEQRKGQVNYYIDQNFAYSKKNEELEKDAKEHDSTVKALKDTIQKHEERAVKDRQKYKLVFDNKFYRL
ncbi:hypothetical protein G4B88_001306 [Cannabis sativa]|uniref:Uncharacterized protein n=1 Tax=Cannabis sativa TaxID=3483 RepID=A0A7J6I126_CANSA|nr:hypothetical protein G4B88_001306 [Cannabis sativa]